MSISNIVIWQYQACACLFLATLLASLVVCPTACARTPPPSRETAASVSEACPLPPLSSFQFSGPPISLKLKNASGLTWHDERKTLWLVSNKPPIVYELTSSGKILQSFPLKDVTDPEGICWLGGSRFAIVEEQAARLRIFGLSEAGKLIEEPENSFQVDNPKSTIVDRRRNNPQTCGLEGLTYDISKGIFWIAKEKKPIRMYRIKYTSETGAILLPEPWPNLAWRVKDVSGLYWCPLRKRLWVLSDQSAVVIELDENGIVVDNLPLLIEEFPKRSSHVTAGEWLEDAEGITLDDEGKLYICCEPNLLYRLIPKEVKH